ncbi:D-alanyl-D-alanine carboxypeptidase family protein [Brevibacillus fluminis]|uniref:M15 family metallopeptidase n=1 Tax=Brevibacillus fluminis TaxID=511487 RepID=UPI003F8BD08D
MYGKMEKTDDFVAMEASSMRFWKNSCSFVMAIGICGALLPIVTGCAGDKSWHVREDEQPGNLAQPGASQGKQVSLGAAESKKKESEIQTNIGTQPTGSTGSQSEADAVTQPSASKGTSETVKAKEKATIDKVTPQAASTMHSQTPSTGTSTEKTAQQPSKSQTNTSPTRTATKSPTKQGIASSTPAAKPLPQAKLLDNIAAADLHVLVNKQNALPASYIPSDLVTLNIPFSFSGKSPKKMLRKEAAEALESLVAQAEREKIKLVGVSGYRPYHLQEAIFASNVKAEGFTEANRTSAIPGQSEHQTGLSIDISSPVVKNQLTEKLGETAEGKWLAQNAYQFGFVIRYPQDKEKVTGYSYEPWHIRYVGKDMAKVLHEKNLTLEEYYQTVQADHAYNM